MSFCLIIEKEAEPAFEVVRNLAVFRLKSICSLVSSYITHETPTITFDKLHELLDLHRDALEHCIYAVGYMFSECIKHRINPYDFTDVIGPAQLNEESVAVLSQFYDRITLSLKKQEESQSVPQGEQESELKNVNWRLDVELSNKSLNRVYAPSFLLEFNSLYQGNLTKEYFEADYVTLKSIRDELQNAVQTSWDACCNDFHYLITNSFAVCYLMT